MRVRITVFALAMTAVGAAEAGSITTVNATPQTASRSVLELKNGAASGSITRADSSQSSIATSRSVLTLVDPAGAVSGETVAAVAAKPAAKKSRPEPLMVIRGGIVGDAFVSAPPEPAESDAAEAPAPASTMITGKKWLSKEKPIR